MVQELLFNIKMKNPLYYNHEKPGVGGNHKSLMEQFCHENYAWGSKMKGKYSTFNGIFTHFNL